MKNILILSKKSLSNTNFTSQISIKFKNRDFAFKSSVPSLKNLALLLIFLLGIGRFCFIVAYGLYEYLGL